MCKAQKKEVVEINFPNINFEVENGGLPLEKMIIFIGHYTLYIHNL